MADPEEALIYQHSTPTFSVKRTTSSRAFSASQRMHGMVSTLCQLEKKIDIYHPLGSQSFQGGSTGVLNKWRWLCQKVRWVDCRHWTKVKIYRQYDHERWHNYPTLVLLISLAEAMSSTRRSRRVRQPRKFYELKTGRLVNGKRNIAY